MLQQHDKLGTEIPYLHKLLIILTVLQGQFDINFALSTYVTSHVYYEMNTHHCPRAYMHHSNSLKKLTLSILSLFY
jgi:hypothetical protein